METPRVVPALLVSDRDWSRASSAAPRLRARARSSSRSTRWFSAGGRATCERVPPVPRRRGDRANHERPGLPQQADGAGGQEPPRRRRDNARRCSRTSHCAGRASPWLRGLTSLPLLVKGVLTSEDARRALDAGVDGIVVWTMAAARSTARSPRSTPSPTCAAPSPETVLFVDGGIRCGADVVKRWRSERTPC